MRPGPRPSGGCLVTTPNRLFSMESIGAGFLPWMHPEAMQPGVDPIATPSLRKGARAIAGAEPESLN